MSTRCKMRCCWTSSRRCVTPCLVEHLPLASRLTPRLVCLRRRQGMLDFATELGLIGEGNTAANPGTLRPDGNPLARCTDPTPHRRPRPQGAHDAARDEVRRRCSPVLACFPPTRFPDAGPTLLVVVPSSSSSPLRLHHAGPSGAEVAAAAREALLQHSLKRAAQAVRVAWPRGRCDPPAPLCPGLTRLLCSLRHQEDPDAMYLDRSGPTPPHKKKARAHAA